MKEKLINKIRSIIQEGIEDERQLLYFLVVIRKLLELNKECGDYKVLKLYSDWALHTSLHRSTAIENFFDEAEQHRFITFDVFFVELEKLIFELDLYEHSVNHSFLNNPDTKIIISNLLVDIYHDVPLSTPDKTKTITISKYRSLKKPNEAFSVNFKKEFKIG